MNHTSDQHPWFLESRSAGTTPRPTGTSGTTTTSGTARGPRRLHRRRERSNWTWDDSASQYYWHRFYSHQPDLNYDNPEVADTMLDVVRFWLDLGLDGFRLDAVPYLFQRDGTAGENLPETHAFIRRHPQAARGGLPGPDPPGRGERVARATWPTTSATATNATCASTSR